MSLENNATLFISTTTGGGSKGRGSYDCLVFTKIRGVSSISLWKALSTGIHITTIEFKFYDVNDVVYYSIKLSDCFVIRIKKTVPELPGGLNAFETIELKPANKISWKDYTTVQQQLVLFG